MNTYDDQQDHTAQLLAQALREEAATVEPSTGALQTIAARTGQAHLEHRRSGSSRASFSRSRKAFATLGAGLATAAVITTVVVVADRTRDGGAAPAQEPTGTEQTGMHPGVYVPKSERSAEQHDAAMFYFGPADSDGTVHMYVERHTVSDEGDNAQLHEFFTSTPIDPDYQRGWPAGVDVKGGSVDQRGVGTFELIGDVDLTDPSGLSPKEARAAIQALMYGASSTRAEALQRGPIYPADIEKFRFIYNGEPLTQLFGLDVSSPVGITEELGAPVQLSSVNQGTDYLVDGLVVSNPVVVEGFADVFEGNVNWQLLDASGAVLDEGHETAATDAWAPFTVKLGILEPGGYTIRAFEVSAKDGSETFVDDKAFTVE